MSLSVSAKEQNVLGFTPHCIALCPYTGVLDVDCTQFGCFPRRLQLCKGHWCAQPRTWLCHRLPHFRVGAGLGEVLPRGPSVCHLQDSQLWDSSWGASPLLLSCLPLGDEFLEFFCVAPGVWFIISSFLVIIQQAAGNNNQMPRELILSFGEVGSCSERRASVEVSQTFGEHFETQGTPGRLFGASGLLSDVRKDRKQWTLGSPSSYSSISNRHPYLRSDLPTGFCIRFSGKGFCCFKKKKCLKPPVYALCDFVSLHNLGAVLSHSPWNWKMHLSLGPSPQPELIFTKLPGFLRWVAIDLA